MEIGSTLLLALIAGAVGALVQWGATRLGAPSYVVTWLMLAAALFVMAAGTVGGLVIRGT